MAVFSIAGPFDIPFEHRPGWRLMYDQFWTQNDELQALSRDCGAYLFALRWGHGYTPIYVGQAAESFEQECFNSANRAKYLEGLADYTRGTPVLFFVVHPEQRGRKNLRQIEQIEVFLIQIAAQKNPDLQNTHHASAPDWAVDGVIRGERGRPSVDAMEFRRAIGFRVPE